jgi:processive 1,2-diacylglycerol beta-glucosyltransferase
MNVLVLTSSTGGGHDLRAAAFQQWAETYADLGLKVHIYRPLEASGWHYRMGVDFYKVVQTVWPGFHHVYWNGLEHLMPFKFSDTLVGVSHYQEHLRELRPEIVISVHPQLNHAFFDLTRKTLGANAVKCVTYCGELSGGYGFSRHWVNPQADLFIGANQACCDKARRLGMPEEKTFLGGFMLRPESYQPRLNEAQKAAYLQETFGFDPGIFTLLLATGALGANNHLAILEALDQAGVKCQVIALCGKDPEVLKRVRRWRSAEGLVTLKAIAYSADMFRLMSSVSATFTRGGTGTTSECLLIGCPPISNCLGGTMPQECITLDFLNHAGMLRRVDRPRDVVPILQAWIAQPELLKEEHLKIADARPPGSPRAILERLVEGRNPAGSG